MLSAFYEAMTGRGPDLLRAYFLAVAIQMLAANLLVGGGYLSVALPPFFGLATAIGSVLYGVGMVLAVGCAAAVLYRAGEGKLDYVLATIGFALGAWASGRWLVEPIRRRLSGDGAALALQGVVPVSLWLIVPVAIVLLGAAMRVGTPGGRRHGERWGWARTGALVGLTGVGAFVASALTGQAVRPGAAQGSGEFARLLSGDAAAVDYSVFVALGIVAGSMIASRLRGRSPGKPLGSERIVRSLAGGLLMGFSAALVAGDNLLHGLHGVPLLALSSLVFIPGMFLGVWIGIRLGWLR